MRDYLLKNPEILMEVQTALEDKQKETQRLASLSTIQTSKDLIYAAASDGVVGNPNGKTTIVEFYDYNCGFCKRAITDMQEMTKADPELRFVLKELPILGPDSQKAHVVAQAFKHLMPEKYPEFHTRLLGGEVRATEETAMLVATALGADEAKLREEMKNPEIQKGFQATYELAEKLSITGTPSYVVGDEVVFGALGQQVLTEKVAAARADLPDRRVLTAFRRPVPLWTAKVRLRALCARAQGDYRGSAPLTKRRAKGDDDQDDLRPEWT